MRRIDIYTFTLALVTIGFIGPMISEMNAVLSAIVVWLCGPVVIYHAFDSYRFSRKYGRFTDIARRTRR